MTVLFRASYWLWPHFILNLTWPFWYRFTFRTCSGVSFSSLATCSIIDSMKNTTWLEAKRAKTISVKKKTCTCHTIISQLIAPGDRLKLHQFLISLRFCLLHNLNCVASACYAGYRRVQLFLHVKKKNFSSTTFMRRNLRIFIKKSAKIVHIVDR